MSLSCVCVCVCAMCLYNTFDVCVCVCVFLSEHALGRQAFVDLGMIKALAELVSPCSLTALIIILYIM